MQTSDSIVIIPTYNERENIENIIRAVFGLPKVFHILVIEDGSPDGTATIVKTLQQEFPERLFMIERKGKLGLGTAYITGFKWALEHTYEYIFEMDADFSHNPNDLPRLYQACAEQGGDVSIGSRYVSGVNVVNWPMGRVLMSYFASKYVRFITGGRRFFFANQYLGDFLVFNHNRTRNSSSFVDNNGILNQCTFHFFCGNLWNQLFTFNLITPNMASPKMLLFILEVPNSRLMNITGTSMILKPHL